MIQDIEHKKVNMVITKDLSRLGRDYILAGQYTEIYFPSKKVRCIAVNDGYDSDSPHTDIAPFKNVINEMYARDTSRKIRSAFVTRMQQGEFVGAFAPYGYQRDPADKHHLIVDDQPAAIVEKIFVCAAQGMPPVQIARVLNQKAVPPPAVYRCMKRPALHLEDYTQRKEWTSSTITKILRNVVYAGHMAQGKTSKISFKSDVVIRNPEQEWLVVPNTHQAIVSEELFDLARRRSKQRACIKKGQFSNVFSGIAKCADCGRTMSTASTRKKGSVYNLTCGGYKLYGSRECSNHFIDYGELQGIVLSSLQQLLCLCDEERQKILAEAQRRIRKQTSAATREKETEQLTKRSRQLDALIEKLYEDNVGGLLESGRMKKMLQRYDAESKMIAQRRLELGQKPPNEQPDTTAAKLSDLLEGYTQPSELTCELLYRFVDHIEIGQGACRETEGVKGREQAIKIFFRFRQAPCAKD